MRYTSESAASKISCSTALYNNTLPVAVDANAGRMSVPRHPVAVGGGNGYAQTFNRTIEDDSGGSIPCRPVVGRGGNRNV